MRYPPTCAPLSMGTSAIATRPVGDVVIAARLAVPSDASSGIAETRSRRDLAPHSDAGAYSRRLGAVKPDRRLFRAVLREVGDAPWPTLSCGDGGGGGDELAGRMP
ncbi:hypothetical protein M878_20985 [Streptomyces roseochromogenus subsp. oscitans DS 12.976]|uniref:Uncharacterized protein n=1 Tax=Streptomyces roseochromogenus subsp. oscitans DS 12.976 TaxID=1352936 RepID=V6KCG4_STRRC|nr:hypothetical protein M878_20985 [Streptomyces roseochromogenus subsp. oscitans DS 12.976]